MIVKRAARVGVWLTAGAIVALSLLPDASMISLGSGYAGHFIAYLILVAAADLGYGRWLGYGRIALVAIIAAALLEVAQFWASDRTPSIADFVASSLGALLGIAIAIWIRKVATAKRAEELSRCAVANLKVLSGRKR